MGNKRKRQGPPGAAPSSAPIEIVTPAADWPSWAPEVTNVADWFFPPETEIGIEQWAAALLNAVHKIEDGRLEQGRNRKRGMRKDDVGWSAKAIRISALLLLDRCREAGFAPRPSLVNLFAALMTDRDSLAGLREELSREIHPAGADFLISIRVANFEALNPQRSLSEVANHFGIDRRRLDVLRRTDRYKFYLSFCQKKYTGERRIDPAAGTANRRGRPRSS